MITTTNKVATERIFQNFFRNWKAYVEKLQRERRNDIVARARYRFNLVKKTFLGCRVLKMLRDEKRKLFKIYEKHLLTQVFQAFSHVRKRIEIRNQSIFVSLDYLKKVYFHLWRAKKLKRVKCRKRREIEIWEQNEIRLENFENKKNIKRISRCFFNWSKTGNKLRKHENLLKTKFDLNSQARFFRIWRNKTKIRLVTTSFREHTYFNFWRKKWKEAQNLYEIEDSQKIKKFNLRSNFKSWQKLIFLKKKIEKLSQLRLIFSNKQICETFARWISHFLRRRKLRRLSQLFHIRGVEKYFFTWYARLKKIKRLNYHLERSYENKLRVSFEHWLIFHEMEGNFAIRKKLKASNDRLEAKLRRNFFLEWSNLAKKRKKLKLIKIPTTNRHLKNRHFQGFLRATKEIRKLAQFREFFIKKKFFAIFKKYWKKMKLDRESLLERVIKFKSFTRNRVRKKKFFLWRKKFYHNQREKNIHREWVRENLEKFLFVWRELTQKNGRHRAQEVQAWLQFRKNMFLKFLKACKISKEENFLLFEAERIFFEKTRIEAFRAILKLPQKRRSLDLRELEARVQVALRREVLLAKRTVQKWRAFVLFRRCERKRFFVKPRKLEVFRENVENRGWKCLEKLDLIGEMKKPKFSDVKIKTKIETYVEKENKSFRGRLQPRIPDFMR